MRGIRNSLHRRDQSHCVCGGRQRGPSAGVCCSQRRHPGHHMEGGRGGDIFPASVALTSWMAAVGEGVLRSRRPCITYTPPTQSERGGEGESCLYLSQDVDQILVLAVHTVGCVSAEPSSNHPEVVQSCHPHAVLVTAITEGVDLQRGRIQRRGVGGCLTSRTPRRVRRTSEAGHSGRFSVVNRSCTKLSNNGRKSSSSLPPQHLHTEREREREREG